MNRNTTTINISKITLSELEELVDRRKSDTHSTILNKVIDEFKRMEACLEQHNLLKQLHPEWELSEMEKVEYGLMLQ